MSEMKVLNCYTHEPPDLLPNGDVNFELAWSEMIALAKADNDKLFLEYLLDPENKTYIAGALEDAAYTYKMNVEGGRE